MKKSKLLILSLLAIGAIGLTSCGEAGPKGDKGDPGEAGQKGETGAPGKDGINGEDGEDGKSFLNGEGEPASTLGNDGDSYLDTKSYDLYVKESGVWVKKGNIKGADGEKGEKGDTGAKGEKGDTGSSGSRGSDGKDAQTTYSNTISIIGTSGHVSTSVGSCAVGEEITFKLYGNTETTIPTMFIVNDVSYLSDVLKNKVDDHYEYTTKMIKGGFSVSAYFRGPGSGHTVINEDTGDLYASIEKARKSNAKKLLLIKDTEEKNKIVINNGDDVTIDLNDHEINCKNTTETTDNTYGFEVSNGSLSLIGKGNVTDVGSTKSVTVLAVKGNKESDKTATINVGKDVTVKGKVYGIGMYPDNDSSKGATLNFYGTDESPYFININGANQNNENPGKVLIDGATINSSEGESYYAGYADVTIKNSTFTTKDCLAINFRAGKIVLDNNTFKVDFANAGESSSNPKTPDYVACTNGSLGNHGTIFVENGIGGYSSIDSLVINANNKFNYTNKPSQWTDVFTYLTADAVYAPEIKSSDITSYTVKDSELKYRIKVNTFSKTISGVQYNYSDVIIYFKEENTFNEYTLEKFKQEFPYVSDVEGLAFGAKEMRNDSNEWATYTA